MKAFASVLFWAFVISSCVWVSFPERFEERIAVDPTLYSCRDGKLNSWTGEEWEPVLTQRFKTPVACGPYGL